MGGRGGMVVVVVVVSLLMVMSSAAINIPATCTNPLGGLVCAPVVGQNQRVKEAILDTLDSASTIANSMSTIAYSMSTYNCQAYPKMASCPCSLGSKLASLRNSLVRISLQIHQMRTLSLDQIIVLKYDPQEIVDNMVHNMFLQAQDPCNGLYKRVLKRLSRSRNDFIRGAAKGGLKALEASKWVKLAEDHIHGENIFKTLAAHIPHF